jgi:hypothetical protein
MPIGFMDKVINCFIVKGSIERARLRLHDFKSSSAHFDSTPLRRNSEFVGFDKLNHRAGGGGSLV